MHEIYRADRAMSVQTTHELPIVCATRARSCSFSRESCMDDFDLRILGALQEDGRLTNNDLADKVGLSASRCARRRAALEDQGIIAGYRAVLSTEALGLDVLVFVHV